MICHLIFDLDGTLFDSLPSIECSARIAVSRALPEMPPPDLRNLVGPPIAAMFGKLWPDLAPEKMAALLREFRSVYDSGGCLQAVAYPGVMDLIPQFHQRGMRLYVLTNKPEKPTRALLQHHGLLPFFEEISCPDSAVPFDSKPLGAVALAQRRQLPPAATALVGDGQDDANAARLCGFRFFHAAYGYGQFAHRENFTRLQTFATLAEHFSPATPSQP